MPETVTQFEANSAALEMVERAANAKAKAERQFAQSILAAYARGLSYRAIADYAGISYEGVRGIVNRGTV